MARDPAQAEREYRADSAVDPALQWFFQGPPMPQARAGVTAPLQPPPIAPAPQGGVQPGGVSAATARGAGVPTKSAGAIQLPEYPIGEMVDTGTGEMVEAGAPDPAVATWQPGGAVDVGAINLDPAQPQGAAPAIGGGFGWRRDPVDEIAFGGGYYFPATIEEARMRIENARLAGKITDEQAAAYEQQLPQKFAEWESSLLGQDMGIVRRQAAGEQERGDIQQRYLAGQAERGLEHAERLNDFQAQQEVAWRQHQERVQALSQRRDQEMARYKEALDEVRNAEVDGSPLNGSEKALAVIASFLGALGEALSGAPNRAHEAIQAEIKNRIHAQEATLANKRAALAGQESVLGQLRQQLGDEYAAREAFKGLMYEQMDAWQREMAARNGTDFALARSEELSSWLNEQMDLSEKNLLRGASAIAVAEEQQRRLMALAHQQAQARAAQAGVPQWVRANPDVMKRYVPGAGGVALSDDDAKHLKDADAARRALLGNLQRMVELSQAPDAKVPMTEKKAQMEAIHADTIGAYNAYKKYGSLDTGTQEIIGRALGDPTSWLDPHAPARAQQVGAAVQYGWQQQIQARGVLPAEVQHGVNDKGDVEAQIRLHPGQIDAGSGAPLQLGEVK